jgi:hypothetical protein
MGWYKESKKVFAQNASDEYSVVRTPSISRYGYKDEVDVEASGIRVPFTVEIEAREWGIKYINIYATETIVVPLTITGWTEDANTIEREMEISVDLGKLPEENTTYGHGVYTVTDIDLELDEAFQVVYENSYISFSKG